MLPAAHRLHGERAIAAISRRSKPSFSTYFILRSMPSETHEPRFVFVVSAKVSKKSTDRNLIRRRLREITRHHLAEVRKGLNVMVSVKPSAVSLGYHDLEQRYLESLKKARLLNS